MMIRTLINYMLNLRERDKTMKNKHETNIRFTEDLLDHFRKNVGHFQPETGGMIGCSGDSSVVDLYVFDKHSHNTSVSFDYDAEEMTKVYREWKNAGGNAVGFIHSHPYNFNHPSYDDISMALTLMRFFKNDYFYMPIVRVEKQGLYTMFFYVLHISGSKIIESFEYVVKAEENGYTILPQNKITNV